MATLVALKRVLIGFGILVLCIWMYIDIFIHRECESSPRERVFSANIERRILTIRKKAIISAKKVEAIESITQNDVIETMVLTKESNFIIKPPPESTTAKVSAPEYYVMTMLTVFNDRVWPGYENFTAGDLAERDNEYLDTLDRNLKHKNVKEIHLFYIYEDALSVLGRRMHANLHKVVPVKIERPMHMSDFFIYASRKLVNKAAIAMNGDIVLGEGFDKINTEKMRDEKVMYSLSRYYMLDKTSQCNLANMKLPSDYMVSHDTHVFRLAEPLNETLILDKLNYPINMWGAENAMIWTFKFLLKFTVRNPAKVLATYHNHCSKVHGPSKEGIDEHKYSILYLPNANWTKQDVLDSKIAFEDKLSYRMLS